MWHVLLLFLTPRLPALSPPSLLIGKHAVLDDESYSASFQTTCEVGIRPSFYWVDSPATQDQRHEVEASMRFMKADCQDDARVVQNFASIPGLTFIGVFDGHGPHGRAAAKFASERLPAALAATMAAQGARSERKRLKAMREACRQVDAAMRDPKQAGFDASLSGTTACFALVEGNRVLLANVGDSRCIFARQKHGGEGVEGIALTVDAKPQLPEELKRITACGGVVLQLLGEDGRRQGAYRVFRRGDSVLPGLAMSRSLGDTYAHSVGVTWEPTMSAHTLTSRDLFLVLGTDGLWDVMDDSAAADFVERYRNKRDLGVSCAEALTLEAQERWKAAHDEALVDDISVAILHVAPLPPPEREASLPRPLPRAASCNDEANALWNHWKKGLSEHDDPSNHSPRRFFDHLYREDSAGVAAVSAPANLQTHGSLKAVEAEDSMPSPGRTISGLANVMEDMALTEDDGEPAAPSSPEPPAQAPRPTMLAADQYQALERSAASVPAFSRASPSMNIPGKSSSQGVDRLTPSASAPVGGLLAGADCLRPVRKAYPSTNAIPTVPSWDGAFYHSFKSDLSPFSGNETPRSSESNGSGRGEDLLRPRRGEMRHEGKVHRGVPQSFSSNGLASHCRTSTDSESTSLGNSRVGSLEEKAILGLASPRDFGVLRAPPSPFRGGLQRGSSDAAQHAGIHMLPRARSHGALSGMGQHRSTSGRVIVLRDVNMSASAVAVGHGQA